MNDNDNVTAEDINGTVSQGYYLLQVAHKCVLEAICLLSGSKEYSESVIDKYVYQLAIHALRRSVLAVRVIELFPSRVFEELAHAKHAEAEGKIFWEIMRSGCKCNHTSDDDGNLPNLDSENAITNRLTLRNISMVDGLRRHLVALTLMCYSVLLLCYIVHTKRDASNFIHALDYCNDVLSFVPGVGTSLFDRELALLHARYLMKNCKFKESEIDKALKICLMLVEEERKRQLRDSERMNYLQNIHSPCRNKVAFGG